MCAIIGQLLWGLIVFLTFTASKCQDVKGATIISYKEGTAYNSYCVVNGDEDSAIAWNGALVPITDEDKYEPEIFSEYVPGGHNKYNCAINNDVTLLCNAYWTNTGRWRIGNSLDGILGPVTDRRWEEFEMYYTNGSANFKKIGYISESNFSLHLSLRMKKEAQFFLCDGLDPPNANCYWILLAGFKGENTAIRKCQREHVPRRGFPRGTCRQTKAFRNHSSSDPILNWMEWRHFTIQKSDNSIFLKQVGEDNPILTYSDSDNNQINIRYLIIRSYDTPGYWKLHDYAYTFTYYADETWLGEEMHIEESNFCIMMFVAMCSQCNVILEVYYWDGQEFRWANGTTIKPKQEMTWQQEKLVMKLPRTPATVKLHVKSICATRSNYCNNPFWAIDSFRICSENEVRVLSRNEVEDSASCQIIKYPNQNVFQTEVQNDDFPERERNCPIGTFGKNCLDCSMVMSSEKSFCQSSTICDIQSDGRSICRCAMGFTGTACDTKCNNGWYGFGCKERCGRCEYLPCWYISGDCAPPKCLSDFTDSQCKTPPFPVLSNPPTVVEEGHTYFKVQLQNIYYGKGHPSYYRIQYREQLRGWKQSEEYDLFANTPIVTIKGLKTSTTYIVRAILFTANNEAYSGDYVPTVNITTTCVVVEQSDITIQTSNTSATIIFEDDSESCKSAYYKVVVLNHNITVTSSTFEFNIHSLKPATTYNIHIVNKIMNTTLLMKFDTQEGAPEPVQQITVTKEDTTAITINWQPPLVTNGIIKYYDIQYKHLKYIACGHQQGISEDFLQSTQVKGTTTTIENLRPYSEYLIKVVAATSVTAGVPATIRAYTSETDTPEKSEFSDKIEVNALSTIANIILQQPNCEEVKGSLAFDVKVKCLSRWCSQNSENIQQTNTNVTSISLWGLQAYCNYTLTIKARRKTGTASNGPGATHSFTTKTSVPHQLKSITVYYKDENSISFRLLPPYPPTGEIDKYCLVYCQTEYSCREQYIPATKCSNECSTQHFDCVTLQNLQSLQEYTVTVRAKNVGTNCSTDTERSTAAIQVKTIQEPPSILENFMSAWDNYYNLTLTWSHPVIENGPLKHFVVKITSNETVCFNKNFPVTTKDYNCTYYYVVPLKKCYSSTINIRTAAVNKYEGPPAELNILSPPPIPSFSNSLFTEKITNTTITINFPAPQNLAGISTMYVIVTSTKVDPTYTNGIEKVPEIQRKLNLPNNAFSWIAAEYDFSKVKVAQKKLLIGDGSKSRSPLWNTELYNRLLHANTSYIISALIINKFGSFERYSVHNIEARTTGSEQVQSSNYGLLALLLLLILPLILFIYIRRKKDKNVSWLSMLNATINLAPNRRNPDVIPLATSVESKPAKVIIPSQLRPKRKIPTVTDVNLTQPGTSTASSEFSKPVKIIEFEQYVKESIKTGELERQHQLFSRGQTKPWDYGLLPQNKSKNRYNNLIAYDHTRVKLSIINNDPYSDYINANYIEGYNTKKAYIATQGPKASTVNDFWRMIWQENVNHIIILANVIEAGKKKTEQYWPNVNEHLEFENIKVDYVSSRIFADYEYRTFLVSFKNEERRVEQLHFTSWPDHAVPLYSQSLVPFLRKMLTIPQGNSPIVVHCSAGVGRTGTIILCDLCLRMAAREGVVDVLKHQYKLREQRANLVDNIEQYKLAHLVLLECLVAPQTSIRCDEEMEDKVLRLLESERVAQQMLYLRETAWQDQAMRPPLQVAPNPEWSTKNRIQDIIPCGYGRVYLSRYPVSDEHSDYINAVEVDGFRSPERFIVTQQPLPHTISDFWRMIDEKEVTTIVSLNKINLGDETSCVFWPTSNATEIQPVPFLVVQFHKKSSTDHYSVITTHLHNKKDKKTVKRTVNLIILKGWPVQKLVPDEVEPLLKLWEETERFSRGENAIVVTCYDGAKACGLFIALSFIIEKMKLEQECDVCLAVRTVRHNRTQFVAEIEQFLYLYRAAIGYLSCFDLYSNFTPAGKK